MLFNDSTALKFSVIDERQVIFFNPILDGKKETYEEPDKWISPAKDYSQSEYYYCMRLKVAEIVSEIINKFFFNLSIFLFSLIAHVLDRLDKVVWDIKELNGI